MLKIQFQISKIVKQVYIAKSPNELHIETRSQTYLTATILKTKEKCQVSATFVEF